MLLEVLLDVIRVCLVFFKGNRIYKVCVVFFQFLVESINSCFFTYPDDLIFLLFLFDKEISVQNDICFELDGFNHDGNPTSTEMPVTQAGQNCY